MMLLLLFFLYDVIQSSSDVQREDSFHSPVANCIEVTPFWNGSSCVARERRVKIADPCVFRCVTRDRVAEVVCIRPHGGDRARAIRTVCAEKLSLQRKRDVEMDPEVSTVGVDAHSSGLSNEMLIGLIVFGVTFVSIVAAIAYCVFHKHYTKKNIKAKAKAKAKEAELLQIQQQLQETRNFSDCTSGATEMSTIYGDETYTSFRTHNKSQKKKSLKIFSRKSSQNAEKRGKTPNVASDVTKSDQSILSGLSQSEPTVTLISPSPLVANTPKSADKKG